MFAFVTVNIELETITKHVDDSSQYSAVGKPINNGTIVIKVSKTDSNIYGC